MFPKAARLSRGSGWEMVVDGDDVEFVVKQVEESDLGRSQFEMNLDMLVRFVGKLTAEFGKQKTAKRRTPARVNSIAAARRPPEEVP